MGGFLSVEDDGRKVVSCGFFGRGGAAGQPDVSATK
jgi:hypothetical protein